MEPEPFPRAPAGLRSREFELPVRHRVAGGLTPQVTVSREFVEVY